MLTFCKKTKVIANDQGIDQNSQKVEVYTLYLYNEKQKTNKQQQQQKNSMHFFWSLRLHGARAGDSLEMIETKSLNMTVSTVIHVHINQFDR